MPVSARGCPPPPVLNRRFWREHRPGCPPRPGRRSDSDRRVRAPGSARASAGQGERRVAGEAGAKEKLDVSQPICRINQGIHGQNTTAPPQVPHTRASLEPRSWARTSVLSTLRINYYATVTRGRGGVWRGGPSRRAAGRAVPAASGPGPPGRRGCEASFAWGPRCKARWAKQRLRVRAAKIMMGSCAGLTDGGCGDDGAGGGAGPG